MSSKYRFDFIFILLSLLTAGCVSFTPEEPGENCTIFATCPQTRTTNEGLATIWQDSDKLSLFVDRQGFFSNLRFAYSGDNKFTGKIPTLTGNQKIYAVYPYTSNWTSPESLSINVNSVSQQRGNGSTSHLAGTGFPLYGTSYSSGDISFAMEQLLAVGKFIITNGEDSPIIIKSIEFTSPVAVAGEFEVDITGEEPVYYPVEGNATGTVTLTVESGAEIAAGQSASFYAGFVPFDVKGDFHIEVTAVCDGDEVVSAKDIESKEIALEAGVITSLNYTFVHPVPVVTEVYIGSFNLVNEYMDAYMAEAENVYTDSNWRGYSALSIVDNYPNGDNGDLQDWGEAYSFDRPVPVSIPVEGFNGNMVTVTIMGDGDFADERKDSFEAVTDGAVKIYNLIPDRRYHYIISKHGEELCRGCFDTEGRRRIMKVSDVVSADKANNFRDLGGMKTIDGKVLKYGKVFRGTNMDDLTTSEKKYMTDELNIGLDVDLRRASDSGRNQAKRILDASKVDYSNVGFMNSEDLNDPEKIKPTILSILGTLQSGKSVYIHCFAGADRTGCICMLLEALCGVSEKDCTIDYELTSFSCVSTRRRTTNDGFMGYFHPYLSGLSGSTFKAKAERFLLDCGITTTQISALQNALIDNE